MSKKKAKEFTETVNYAELRKLAGLTLGQASKLSGYGIATINGLEKTGEGSARLRQTLIDLYQASTAAEHLNALQENPALYGDFARDKQLEQLTLDLRCQTQRADNAERKVSKLKKALSDLLNNLEKL